MIALTMLASVAFVPTGPIVPTHASSTMLLSNLHTAPTHLQAMFADPNFGTLQSGISSTSHGMAGAPHELLRKLHSRSRPVPKVAVACATRALPLT